MGALKVLIVLLQIIKFFLWDHLEYTVALLIFGTIIFAAWKRANTRAEQGLNGLWHWLFSYGYFVLEGVSVLVIILIVVRGAPWLYGYTRDQLRKGAGQMGDVSFEAPSVPGGPGTLPDSTQIAQALQSAINTPVPTIPPTPGNQLLPQTVIGIFTYTVSDPSGATAREACNNTSTQVGTIPSGSTVTLSSLVDSNCVGSVCKRGVVQAVDPLPVGWDPIGACVHLAALSAK